MGAVIPLVRGSDHFRNRVARAEHHPAGLVGITLFEVLMDFRELWLADFHDG